MCSVPKSCPIFATPWTVALQTLLFLKFSRQQYYSELPFPTPGDFPDPGIKPTPPALARWILTAAPSAKPGRRWCCDPLVCGSAQLPGSALPPRWLGSMAARIGNNFLSSGTDKLYIERVDPSLCWLSCLLP